MRVHLCSRLDPTRKNTTAILIPMDDTGGWPLTPTINSSMGGGACVCVEVEREGGRGGGKEFCRTGALTLVTVVP